VEAVLAGKGGAIKSYTIAVEALQRGESFAPARDPIVRVEAGRLRKALARYYGGAGGGRPVLIDLPLGSYVPVFRRRRVRHSSTRLAVMRVRHCSERPLAWSVAAAMLALIAIGPGVLLLTDLATTMPGPMTTATVVSTPAQSRSGTPVVFVRPST
jgi:hypothetical protein